MFTFEMEYGDIMSCFVLRSGTNTIAGNEEGAFQSLSQKQWRTGDEDGT